MNRDPSLLLFCPPPSPPYLSTSLLIFSLCLSWFNSVLNSLSKGDANVCHFHCLSVSVLRTYVYRWIYMQVRYTGGFVPSSPPFPSALIIFGKIHNYPTTNVKLERRRNYSQKLVSFCDQECNNLFFLGTWTWHSRKENSRLCLWWLVMIS